MKILRPYYFDHKDVKGQELLNPIFLMHRALALYNDYLEHKSKGIKNLFLECTDSLTSRLVIKKNLGAWPIFNLSLRAQIYGCETPYVSALLQGQGISVLVRAYSLVKNPKYLVTAEHALKAFQVQMEDGGVLSVDNDDGHWWYEEYASPYAKPSGVLNGFILALLGIYDFYLLTGDDASKRFFDEGIMTLCHHIEDFDTSRPFKLTYYDRQRHVVSIDYHLFHVKLMEILFNITGKEVFRKYKVKWQRYADEWIAHRMYRLLHKLYYIKSGYNLKDSAKILGNLVSERKLSLLQTPSP